MGPARCILQGRPVVRGSPPAARNAETYPPMMKELLAADRLRAALLDAVRRAFSDMKRDHAGEQLYAFAVGSTPLGEFLCVAGNSEESLTRTAENYRAAGYS